MRISGASLLPVALLALVAGLSYWLEKATTAQEARNNANARHDPDYMVDNFTVRRFNETGQLIQSLVAKHMVHFPDDDTTELTAPNLTIHRSDRPTQVVSKTAWLSKDGKEIQLKGNVRVSRPAVGAMPFTLIETEALTVYPDDERTVGSVPVTITRGGNVMHGSGIEYLGKDKTAQLQGRVHGTFKKATP
ncbi:LPS export ABC transporter periplasmic protein LptC [Denitratisoma sp. agr-D3]